MLSASPASRSSRVVPRRPPEEATPLGAQSKAASRRPSPASLGESRPLGGDGSPSAGASDVVGRRLALHLSAGPEQAETERGEEDQGERAEPRIQAHRVCGSHLPRDRQARVDRPSCSAIELGRSTRGAQRDLLLRAASAHALLSRSTMGRDYASPPSRRRRRRLEGHACHRPVDRGCTLEGRRARAGAPRLRPRCVAPARPNPADDARFPGDGSGGRAAARPAVLDPARLRRRARHVYPPRRVRGVQESDDDVDAPQRDRRRSPG